MDDGFQSASIRFDFALLVVDADRGIGNGHAAGRYYTSPYQHDRCRHGIRIVVDRGWFNGGLRARPHQDSRCDHVWSAYSPVAGRTADRAGCSDVSRRPQAWPHRPAYHADPCILHLSRPLRHGIVNGLRSAGIRISLDDFGTGQSSLGRLREISPDKVKIDRSFISEITRDRPSEHIIKAIIALCDGLDMKVVAEGIETDDQAAKLLELGCHTGQGYLYGRPFDVEAVQHYLAEHGRSTMRSRTARRA